MIKVIYRGCQDEYRGGRCEVVGHFASEDTYFPWGYHNKALLRRDTKYRVRFGNGKEVNVYGRNLYAPNTAMSDWAEQSIYEHPKPRDVYRYVTVQILGAGDKKHNFLNVDVELTERDLVVVHSKYGYQIGRVWGCWREEECDATQKFEHSYRFIEHRVDQERMQKIREKDHRMKELDRSIKQRLKELRESIELDQFIAEDEKLACLVQERRTLRF